MTDSPKPGTATSTATPNPSPSTIEPSPSEFRHPETGELLATAEQWQAALRALEVHLAPHFRLRRILREAYAERFEPVLPAPRYRSPTQEKVARCPRCGEKLALLEDETP